ncbi:hypothetical protein [Campylobacter canadensis]|uniref:hypothetical protein n=1 Tax=Campylobacter canadensis TaxID=449520 RepID=UPI001CCD2A8B|nr:hypothetical protein [Campylobacter canadensis]MBZ7995161.1 hypothetical protein [Campylobacter canadensis]MBZ8003837.1 hypothetical protein [Campylobacter canadensis]
MIKMRKILLIPILLMFFAGCSPQKKIIYVKQLIPKQLTDVKSVEYAKYSMQTNADFALFILDLNEAYTECVYKINLIRNEYGK